MNGRSLAARTAALTVAIWLLAAVVGLIAPHGRTWGIHFLAYYPPWAATLFGLAAITCAIVAIRFARDSQPEADGSVVSAPSTAVILLVACGAVVVFYLLCAATALLGDGQLWVQSVDLGAHEPWERRGPLTLIAYAAAFHLLKPVLGIGPAQVIAAGSSLAGGAVVAAWLWLAKHLRLPIILALAAGFAYGGVVIFFGYIEIYSLMAAAVTWMLALAAVSMRRGRPSPLVPLIWVLACGLHFIAFAFLPALLVYGWWAVSRRSVELRPALRLSAVALMLSGLAYFAFGWYRGTDTLLPLLPTESEGGYALLTLRHGLDLLNGFFFVAAPLAVLLILRRVVRRESGGAWRGEHTLLLVSLLFPAAAYVVHHAQLGMARDWDIGAAFLPAAPIISLFALEGLALRPRQTVMFAALLGVFAFLFVGPFVGVQASESRSVARFRDLLHLDAAVSPSGWDYLASHYRHQGNEDAWGECYLEALKHSDNLRYHRAVITHYVRTGQWELAARHVDYMRAVIFSDSVVARWEEQQLEPVSLLIVGGKYSDKGDWQNALRAFDMAARLNPESLMPPLAKTGALIARADFARAEAVLVEITRRGDAHTRAAWDFYQSILEGKIKTDPLVGWIGQCLMAKIAGNYPLAEERARQAVKVSGNDKRVAVLLESVQAAEQ